MLLLDNSLDIHSLAVYRDHAAPGTFHYLPGNPNVVVENGLPHAQLTRFRADRQSGGFLSLDFELDHDPALLKTVQQELSARFSVDRCMK